MRQPSTSSLKYNRTPTSQTLLTFRVGEQVYGLPVPDVIRIIEMVTITPLADLPYPIRGVINIQGKITSVLDVRRRFGLPEQAYGLHTPIILVDIPQSRQMMGLVVDEVLDVITVNATDLETPEAIVPAGIIPEIPGRMGYLASMAKVDRQPVPVLHVQALLSPAEQHQLRQALTGQQSPVLITPELSYE
jgi:purine-binding chemotaxis protein CheW